MIADDIIEAAAQHPKIKQAIEQLIRLKAEPGATTISVTHDFVCNLRGQKLDVKISLQVAGQRRRSDPNQYEKELRDSVRHGPGSS